MLYPNSSIRFWQSVVFSMITSTETNSLNHLQVSNVQKGCQTLPVLIPTDLSSFSIRFLFIQSFIQKQMFSEALLCARYLLLSFLKFFFLYAWFPYLGIKMFQGSL